MFGELIKNICVSSISKPDSAIKLWGSGQCYFCITRPRPQFCGHVYRSISKCLNLQHSILQSVQKMSCRLSLTLLPVRHKDPSPCYSHSQFRSFSQYSLALSGDLKVCTESFSVCCPPQQVSSHNNSPHLVPYIC